MVKDRVVDPATAQQCVTFTLLYSSSEISLLGGTCLEVDQNWIGFFAFSGSKSNWRKQEYPENLTDNLRNNRIGQAPVRTSIQTARYWLVSLA